jgi:hypothetical protein
MVGSTPMKILAPISVGELYDKTSILEIKSGKIIDTLKLEHISSELAFLRDILTQQEIDHSLFHELKEVNGKLWQIEDDIRECERQKDFGDLAHLKVNPRKSSPDTTKSISGDTYYDIAKSFQLFSHLSIGHWRFPS